jgi:N-glycosylase/DNA lyase
MDYYTLTSRGVIMKDFDMRHSLESAQPLTFYGEFDFDERSVEYVTGNSLIKAKFRGDSKSSSVDFDCGDISLAKKDFVRRFRLNDDMKKIYKNISTDEFMASSIKKYHGMRVTQSDPWETALCFIISQYNNVKRIRLIVKRFVKEFGTDILDEDGKVVAKSFPTSEELARFTEKDFKDCGAGFRAKYIAKAADYCTNNLDLYRLQNKDYGTIKNELMQVSGIGEKVADCIALMGYGKMEAFPIDVWVKRTLENVYFKGKEKRIKDLHKFAHERWDGYMGQAQQYISWGGRNI